MGLYDENIKFLEKEYPYIVFEKEAQTDGSVTVAKNGAGEIIVGVERDNYLWFLGSCYDAKKAAEYWLEQFNNITYKTIFIVLGLGNGIYAKKLHERYPNNYIVVCEPDMNICIELMHYMDLKEVFSEKTIFAAGKNCRNQFRDLIYRLINYDNRGDAVYLSIPNYDKVNGNICLQYTKLYRDFMEMLVIARNTKIRAESYRAESFLKNIFLYPFGYNLVDLKQSFKNLETEKRPVIIVSAGPSLDKNIQDLKYAQGKAFIIVVDTALKAVLSAGIRPDFTVTVDPQKNPATFDIEGADKLPLAASVYGNSSILENHTGKIFFSTAETDIMNKQATNYKKSIWGMDSGGSVANNAFSIARMIGFKTIILVGQDLAYPGGKIHAEKAYESYEPNTMKKTNTYIEVEDIYGEKVWTMPNMNVYKKWYEEQILLYPDCKVIDATEGGALIHGSEIMTLKEAVKQECESLSYVDFGNVIEGIEPLFDERQREEIVEVYMGIGHELELLKKKIAEGKKHYASLKKYAQKEQYDVPKYKKTIKKISRMVEEIDTGDWIDFLSIYGNESSYMVKDDLNSKGKEEKNEALRTLKAGEQICDRYIKNIEQVQKEWRELLKEHGYIQAD